MRMVWGAAAAFGMLGFAASAWAGEDAVKLKDGPGKDLVQSACVGCHSLDYPITN